MVTESKSQEAYRELLDNPGNAGQVVIDGQKAQWQRDGQGTVTVEYGTNKVEHHFAQVSRGDNNGMNVRDIHDRADNGGTVRDETDFRYDRGGNLQQRATRIENEQIVMIDTYDGKGGLIRKDEKDKEGDDRTVDKMTLYDSQGNVTRFQTITRTRESDERDNERIITRTPNGDGTNTQVTDHIVSDRQGTTVTHIEARTSADGNEISGTRTTTGPDGKTTYEVKREGGGGWQLEESGQKKAVATEKRLDVNDLEKTTASGPPVEGQAAQLVEQMRNRGMRFPVAEVAQSAFEVPAGQAYAAEALEQARNRKPELS